MVPNVARLPTVRWAAVKFGPYISRAVASWMSTPEAITSISVRSRDRAAATRTSTWEKSQVTSTCPGSARKQCRSRGSCFFSVWSAGLVMLIRPVLARSVLICGCTRSSASAQARNAFRLVMVFDPAAIARRAANSSRPWSLICASPRSSARSSAARLSAVTCTAPLVVRGQVWPVTCSSSHAAKRGERPENPRRERISSSATVKSASNSASSFSV